MYDFAKIEQKWHRKWSEQNIYNTPDNPTKKFYLLEMYAYPSGDIHIGHFRNYGVGDTVWRYLRMNGYDLLHPFGWDAFGLPAEQAAIKHGLPPREWTIKNIETGKKTIQELGISYDWDREIRTCEPDYYKWTQWVFLKLYQAGLVYRDTSTVNWCPSCKTVLANEQIIGGKCWRCDSIVEKRELEQWFIKITDYVQRLLDDLDKLEGKWPQNIITMQRNWIGRSEGGEFDFPIDGTDIILPIFTTRPDTIYGVTFMSVAPDAKIMKKILPYISTDRQNAIGEYIKTALNRTEIERSTESSEKDGVFTGLYAINPFDGEKVQIWVADYVLASYGTGAVMAVPAHDQRDFEFAKKYNIPIKVVIQPKNTQLNPDEMTEAYTDTGIMVNSKLFDGTFSTDGIGKVIEYASQKGIGRKKITYRLRDWLISRQRYWGAPIPMVHCDKCGTVPVPEEQLPVLLPQEDKVDFIPKGRSPLSDVPEFVDVKCPKCGGPAKRDTDTMDTFVCSSWYYLRYLDPHNEHQAFAQSEAKKWLPIDLYIGGAEHATGHLIYSRFVHKVLFDLGYIPKECGDEPAKRLFNHGMVLDEHGDVMSKSKGNVISPGKLIEKIGIDATRVAMLFFAPPEKEILWSESAVKGAVRFLTRVESLFGKSPQSKEIPDVNSLTDSEMVMLKSLHRTIKRVGEDTRPDRMQFNTAIAGLMEFLNILPQDFGPEHKLYYTVADNFVRLLAPFAPFIAEELNEKLGFDKNVFTRNYPKYNENLAKIDEIEIGVQINGKLRGTINISTDASQQTALELASSDSKISKWFEGKAIRKVIYIEGKILNIITK
ncbi:leucine--tRNA ligase [bacterium]|nr:leucine--tRNA ligase [bacterium]